MQMTVRQLTAAAMMTALICVLSPVSVPLSSLIPLSLATLAVMLTAGLIGPLYGTLSVMLYILPGILGIPVFAGYSSGIGIVFGVSGGYIIGYLPLAFLLGYVYERFRLKNNRKKETAALLAGCLPGNAVLYLIGTIWFVMYTGSPVQAALAACVLPFIPGDLLKIAAVCILVPRLKPVSDSYMKKGRQTPSPAAE